MTAKRMGWPGCFKNKRRASEAEVESRRGADMNSEDNEKSTDDDDENCTTYQVRIPLVL